MLVLVIRGNNLNKTLNIISFYLKEQVKNFHAIFNMLKWELAKRLRVKNPGYKYSQGSILK